MQQDGEGTLSPLLKLRVPVLTGVLRSLSFHCVGKTAASLLLCNHTSQLQVLSQGRQGQSALQSQCWFRYKTSCKEAQEESQAMCPMVHEVRWVWHTQQMAG